MSYFDLVFNGTKVLEKRDSLAVMIRVRELLERKDVEKIEIVKEES